jgi:hypothetical protein
METNLIKMLLKRIDHPTQLISFIEEKREKEKVDRSLFTEKKSTYII